MPNTPVSPKVKAGANWAAYATLALTLLSTITPANLQFLGAYAPLAYGAVIGGTYALGAYLKADPLRDAGAATVPDVSAPAVSAPAAPAPAAAPAATFPAAAVAAAEVSVPEITAPEVTPTVTPAQ